MKKNPNFTFTHIKNFIPNKIITRTAQNYRSDYYCKKFNTKLHLLTMMHSVLSGCTSLREIESTVLLSGSEYNQLGYSAFPKRSTISDANMKRNSNVFQAIYFELLKKYKPILSDSSRTSKDIFKNLTIIDSTTISLFSDISKGAGRNPKQGKKKGGIKLHTAVNAFEDVPNLVKITDATKNDKEVYKHLDSLKKGSIITFDRGYTNYTEYQKLSDKGIYFVTRQKKNAKYESIKENDLLSDTPNSILIDEEIIVGKKELKLRKIAYWYEDRLLLEFITNNFELKAAEVCEIYKRRWQIELLFKRLKQNYPLKYFLGDNRNAIEIQIWVTLIVDLILQVIKLQIKRKPAFSTIVSIIRLNLMVKVNIIDYFNNPEKYINQTNINLDQLKLKFE